MSHNSIINYKYRYNKSSVLVHPILTRDNHLYTDYYKAKNKPTHLREVLTINLQVISLLTWKCKSREKNYYISILDLDASENKMTYMSN